MARRVSPEAILHVSISIGIKHYLLWQADIGTGNLGATMPQRTKVSSLLSPAILYTLVANVFLNVWMKYFYKIRSAKRAS